jgi:hypothetical protein
MKSGNIRILDKILKQKDHHISCKSELIFSIICSRNLLISSRIVVAWLSAIERQLAPSAMLSEHEQILNFNNASIRTLSRRVRAEEYCLQNRLKSVYEDFSFLSDLLKQIQGNSDKFNAKNGAENKASEAVSNDRFLIYANLRCGSWYVPSLLSSRVCYFKSSDGHCHHWQFSINRLNLHILHDIINNNYKPCIIVDSTRLGKKFPDSFTRTIPIWITVINSTLHKFRQNYLENNENNLTHKGTVELFKQYINSWDCELNMHTSISTTEKSQIQPNLSQFIASLENSGENLLELAQKLTKPLRVIWVNRESNISWLQSTFQGENLPFQPLLLLNPSKAEASLINERCGWKYIQGAADDEINWARGLTVELFWRNYDSLIGPEISPLECEENAKEIVKNSKKQENQREGEESQAWEIGENSGVFIVQSARPPSLQSLQSRCEILGSKTPESLSIINLQCLLPKKTKFGLDNGDNGDEDEESEMKEAKEEEASQNEGIEAAEEALADWPAGRKLVLAISAAPKSKYSLLKVFRSCLVFIATQLQANRRVLISSNDITVSAIIASALLLQFADENYAIQPIQSVENLNSKDLPAKLTKCSLRLAVNYVKSHLAMAIFPTRLQLKQLNKYFLSK